eukprot:8670947-Ditylum_brightwellii.AAC.1
MPLTRSAKLSNSTKKPFVALTLESTKASTPDSSKNYTKSTNKNRSNTSVLSCTVIAPQNDKENTKQSDINSTTINKPSNLPSKLLHEHSQVSASDKSDLKQSGNKSLTMPTSEPTEPNVRDEHILMMHKMQFDMDNNFKVRQQKHLDFFNSCLSTLSSTVVLNEESLKKLESNLNIMTQTVSKFEHKLVMQKEIYSTHQKDISGCI